MTNRASGSVVIGSPGSGKPIANSERIITPQGMKTIADIKEQDYIFGQNGQPTKVLGVFPQGKKEMYQVTLADRRKIVCSKDHRFLVGTISHKKYKWEIMSVEDIIKKGVTDSTNRHNFYLQNNGALQFPKQSYTVAPYIIGAFLGNGCRSYGDLQVSSGNEEVPNKIALLLSKQLNTTITCKKEKVGYTYSFYFDNSNNRVHAKHLTENEEIQNLLTNCYSYNKYIPDCYKYTTEEDRWELIQGLFDTDGTIGLPPRYNISYCSGSRQLIDDIIEVVRSMGYMYCSERNPDLRKGNPSYNIFVGCFAERKPNFFSYSAKKERALEASSIVKKHYRNYNTLQIIDIQPLNKEEDCTCFMVDAPDHQFIAGDTVVTHNTFFLLNVCANALGMGQRVICIDPKNDFNKLLNVSSSVEFIDINNIRPGALNPFTFLDKFDSSTLLSIIEIICGKLDKQDIIAITPIIQDFIIAYNRDGVYKDMQDVADYLFSRDNESCQKIGNMLKMYEDNKYGKLLFTREENVTPLYLNRGTSLIITLHGMSLPDYTKKVEDYDANERFTSAILYIITTKLYELLSSDNKIPTTLVCDEAHLLYGNKKMSDLIDKFLVIGRSLNTATLLASQGISHFPDNIAQFMSTKVMFRSSMEEAKLFLDKFDTSKIDASTAIDTDSVIASTTKLATGNCFMIDSQNRTGFIHIISNYDVKLLTSNPFQKKRD
jgi:hypothetical protein